MSKPTVDVVTLIEVDHGNNQPRVVFTTSLDTEVPDACVNWALNRQTPMAIQVSMELLGRIPKDMQPLLRLTAPRKTRYSLYLCRQKVTLQ